MVIAVLCVAVLAYVAWTYFKPKQEQPQYISESVTRGDLENTVLATGTLDATKLVSVGAQVSGQVQKMYVQLGDEVKQGQLIAQIDSTTQENSFKTAEANIKICRRSVYNKKPVLMRRNWPISVNNKCMRKMPHQKQN